MNILVLTIFLLGILTFQIDAQEIDKQNVRVSKEDVKFKVSLVENDSLVHGYDYQ